MMSTIKEKLSCHAGKNFGINHAGSCFRAAPALGRACETARTDRGSGLAGVGALRPEYVRISAEDRSMNNSRQINGGGGGRAAGQRIVEAVLIPRLDGWRQQCSDQWIARCPAHDDRSPSLSIRYTEDRVLLHCFAGCSAEAVLEALGLRWTDLYSDPWKAAYRTAMARGGSKLPAPDPADIERYVLRLAAADLRAGKSLSIEDRARVELAKERLGALCGRSISGT